MGIKKKRSAPTSRDGPGGFHEVWLLAGYRLPGLIRIEAGNLAG